ncbi:MAG: cyclic nucleotide-binding domain-containing protein [Thermoleophilaceae bacterium]
MEPARLEQIPLFADRTSDEREALAACMREVTVDAGTPLVTQGDNAYELFVIEAGNAEVRMDDKVVRTLGPGDVVGEIGLLATGTRTASVVATSHLRLLAMFTREFKKLEGRMPGLTKSLRETMAKRVAETSF